MRGWLRGYPHQKIQYLKDVASLFVSYNESFTNDLTESLRRLISGGDTLRFSLSKKTIDLENKLLKYKELNPIISNLKAGITNIAEEITKRDISNISKADRKRMLAYFQSQSRNQLNQLRQARQQIFSTITNPQ